MNSGSETATPTVPVEEVERRLAEYRRLGLQRQAPAQVVYQGAAVACPWAGCDLYISGIHFQLEQLGAQPLIAQWLASWWTGPGLIGRCPRCGRLVLFGLTGKEMVAEPAQAGAAVLPDDWHKKNHLVTRIG